MANVESNIRSWHGAESFLNGRDTRKIAHNTYVEEIGTDEDGRSIYGVRLHSTYVVIYYPDGRVRLNSGGWQTVTTQDRINNLSPYYVGTDGSGGWDVTGRSDGAQFSDHMLSDEDGGWQDWKDFIFRTRRAVTPRRYQ